MLRQGRAYLFWLIIMKIKEDFFLVQKGMNKHNVLYIQNRLMDYYIFVPRPGSRKEFH
jgi:hypothetical protein